jgi:hypothetical protein
MSTSYPKPEGWKGGPDGRIMRQGSAGHLGWNPYVSDDQDDALGDRRNCHDADYFEGVAFGDA